jgi:hypothetical protein
MLEPAKQNISAWKSLWCAEIEDPGLYSVLTAFIRS